MCVSLLMLALAMPAETPDRFIVLAEFQVWADARGPEVFEELNRLYLKTGRSHVFDLYPHYEYYVWEVSRMKKWVDEAASLGTFNLFCLGDDTRTAQGHLFTPEGVNPALKEVLFETTAYAHRRGLMVAVEPLGLPRIKDEQHLTPWLQSWLGPQVPDEARVDIIKLSLEWFGAYVDNPDIADEIETFFVTCQHVAPSVMIYVDSVSRKWRQPQPFHRWLLHRFPGTIVSHYLSTDQVEAFRAVGARNMMVQINPSEIAGSAGQFFIYHDKTVAFLQDVVKHRVGYLSLAGVNFGYNRYNYDLFLEMIRPHLNLAADMQALRKTIQPDQITAPASKEKVRAWLERERAARRQNAPVATPP